MWTVTTLSETCKMYQPKTISAKEMKADGEYVVYGANGIIGKYDKYNHEEPQLLITCRGATCGSVNVSTPFSWINGNAMVIQPDTSKVSLRYMEYLFKGGIDLSRAITGSAQPQITRQSLNDITFSYPPLAEQQRIVAKLDAAFAEIDGALANTAEAVQAAEDGLTNLIDAKTENRTGWCEYKVSDLGVVQTGNTPKTSNKENYGTDVPFVKPPNFQSDGTIVTADEGLSFQGANQSRVADKNSIMMVCIGATIGKVGVCSESVCFNQQINALTPSDKFDAELIYWQMRGKRFQNEVRAKAGQATLPIISKSKWQNLSIFLPSSLREQEEIRVLLRDLNTQTEDYIKLRQVKKHELSNLKSAILTQELQSEAA
jgi:type I restriction enzyme, S subunit